MAHFMKTMGTFYIMKGCNRKALIIRAFFVSFAVQDYCSFFYLLNVFFKY